MTNLTGETAQKIRRISWIIGVLLIVSASVVAAQIVILYQVQIPALVDFMDTANQSGAQTFVEMTIDRIVRNLVIWIFILWMACFGLLVFFRRIVDTGTPHKK